MISKKKMINLILGSIALITMTTAAGMLKFDEPPQINYAGDTPTYVLSLTSANKPTIPGTGFGSGTSTSRYVDFSYIQADEDVIDLNVKLSLGSGSIYNTVPITGFDTIEVVFSGGGLNLYTGNTQAPSTNGKAITSSVIEGINDSQYFRLVSNGSGDILVESVEIIYSCEALPSADLQYSNLGDSYAVTGYVGTDTAIVIPSTYAGKPVSKLAGGAFSGKSTITSFTIPDSVTMIEWNVFLNCTSLLSITIPNSVTSLGNNVFSGCSSLVSVTLPNNFLTIPSAAFGSCTALTSISIPSSVTTIISAAFSSCTSLNSISFQGTVAQWGAITKGIHWNISVPATSVTCTDGSVAIYQSW